MVRFCAEREGLEAAFEVARKIVSSAVVFEQEDILGQLTFMAVNAWVSVSHRSGKIEVDFDAPYECAETLHGFVEQLVETLNIKEFEVHDEIGKTWHQNNAGFLLNM